MSHIMSGVKRGAAIEGQYVCLTSEAAFPVNRERPDRRFPVAAVSLPPTCRDGPVALPLVETFHRNVSNPGRRPATICGIRLHPTVVAATAAASLSTRHAVAGHFYFRPPLRFGQPPLAASHPSLSSNGYTFPNGAPKTLSEAVLTSSVTRPNET
jgi:hypothetical protein